MNLIEIYRGSELFASVKPNDNSSQVKKIMGDNQVTLSFELDHMVDFNVGDYTTIYGEVYTLNSVPSVKKKSKYNYEYDFILQSTQHTLSKAQFLFLGDNNTLKEIDFAYTGTAEKFVDLIIMNVSRVDTGWAKGGIEQGLTITLSFSKEDCFTALKKIAAAFGLEYYIEGKRINLAYQKRDTIYKFMYGSNRGLYNITRSQLEGTSIITRLYAWGGTVNLPNDYRNFSPRLLLPNVPEEHLISNLIVRVILFNGNKRFFFTWKAPLSTEVTGIIINYRIQNTTDWTGVQGGLGGSVVELADTVYEFYFSSITATDHYDTPVITVSGTILSPLFTTNTNYFLERNTDKYGVIEGTLLLEEIYPNRIGKVTSVDATDFYKFKDNTIDFDVNEYLLPGLTAKITFNSGQLAGYTFDISKFDNGLKEFTILKNKDEKAIDVPSALFKPAINDEYVLTEIRMPQTYVDNAEKLLYQKAIEYLQKSSEAQFNYTVDADEKYFKNLKININIGDIVTLEDIELNVAKRIRVIGLTRNIVDEYKYTFELGEVAPPSKIAELLRGQAYNTLLIQRIQNLINGNRLLSGTNIGDLTVQQGGLVLPDLQTGSGTPIYIDANGRIVRGG